MKVAKSERATKEVEAQLFEAREEIISSRRETVSVWKEVVSVKKIVAAQADDIYTKGRKLRECERKIVESTKNAAAAAAVMRLQEEMQVRAVISKLGCCVPVHSMTPKTY